MKIGLNLKIDVTKIDKARLFQGEKGTYLDLSTFIDLDNLDQYGNNGFITQSTTKEEREQKVQLPILGNAKIYYKEGQQQQSAQGNYQAQQAYDNTPRQQQAPQQAPPAQNNFDDIPF